MRGRQPLRGRPALCRQLGLLLRQRQVLRAQLATQGGRLLHSDQQALSGAAAEWGQLFLDGQRHRPLRAVRAVHQGGGPRQPLHGVRRHAQRRGLPALGDRLLRQLRVPAVAPGTRAAARPGYSSGGGGHGVHGLSVRGPAPAHRHGRPCPGAAPAEHSVRPGGGGRSTGPPALAPLPRRAEGLRTGCRPHDALLRGTKGGHGVLSGAGGCLQRRVSAAAVQGHRPAPPSDHLLQRLHLQLPRAEPRLRSGGSNNRSLPRRGGQRRRGRQLRALHHYGRAAGTGADAVGAACGCCVLREEQHAVRVGGG
mmetsp:Transcript_6361/g.14060  ORF Transcript_6361/g.14060 Transcript_6361/m.14060 type:complete len:309 (-) Transcript_6361:605-1531(-)